MKFTQVLVALTFSVAVSAQTECGGMYSYCKGPTCNCFPEGISQMLEADCKTQGYDMALPPSEVADAQGTTIQCTSQCCHSAKPNGN
ncbi:unnamed protein product [Diplocarpon coronariae]